MERRVLQAKELRSAGPMKVAGYAATHNKVSSNLGGFYERIASRAFNRILATKPDCVCLRNHNADEILGRTTSGTLRLKADDKGLAFECSLPNTKAGRDTYESVRRGDLSGCSFAFTTDTSMCEYREEKYDPEFDEDEEGVPARGTVKTSYYRIVRTIRDFASLVDVSVVTHPAYPGTSVDARNLVAAECRSRVDSIKHAHQAEVDRLYAKAKELRERAADIAAFERHQDFVLRILLD